MRYEDLPDLGPDKEWIIIPDTVDFGEAGVLGLTDDEFLRELMLHLCKPIEPSDEAWSCAWNSSSPLTAGGPAVRPEDEYGSI